LHLFRDLTDRHPDLPEAQRGLGLVLLKNGDKAGAAAAFRRYLALRPAADDRAYIESFLQQCDQNS
jgi:beta-barrel assembly-enhancing protease